MTDEQHTGRCRMAEDVKAVAWRVGNSPHGPFALRKAVPRGWAHHEPLYPQSAIEALRAEVERLRNKLQAMHRRAQTAEAAHVEYKKLMAIPPDGDGVRFVNGSLGRVLLGSYCYKLREEAERAEAQAAAADELAAKWERMADEHGVRQFTGNDHRLFANELRAALSRAANDTQAGGGGA